MNCFIGALKKYADFTGRACKQEYWMFILVYFIINIILAVLGLELISALVGLGLLIPSISIATRRLHDTGRSGWWQLIVLIPIIGFIVLIVFLAQDGHDANDYGINPKTCEPYIPAPLEDARFRKSERLIIKAHFFIKGYSLKKKCNAEYDLLSLPQGAGLETLYAALLILTREQPFSSINALPKGVSNSS